MPALNSSAIEFVDYNPDNRNMDIVFTNGGPYTYYDVPIQIYNGLLSASSPGQYFHRVIKDAYEADKRDFNAGPLPGIRRPSVPR